MHAGAFHEGVLGLQVTIVTINHKMEDAHWVEYGIGAGTLAIGVAPGMNPSTDGCSVALEVDDFDKAVSELHSGDNLQFRAP